MMEPYRQELSIEGAYRLDVEDVEAALEAHPPTRRMRRAWIVGVLVLVLYVVGPVVSGVALSSLLPQLGGGIALLVASLLIRRAPRKQIASKTEDQRSLRVTVREHGYRVETAAGESHEINWASVREAAIGVRGIALIRTGQIDYLPKRAFSEEAFRAVVATIRRHVPPVQHRSFWGARGVALFAVLVVIVLAYAVYQLVTDRPGTVLPVECELQLELTTDAHAVVASMRIHNPSDAVAYAPVDGVSWVLTREGDPTPLDARDPDVLASRPDRLGPGATTLPAEQYFEPLPPGRYRVRVDLAPSHDELEAFSAMHSGEVRVCVAGAEVEQVVDLR